MAGRKKTEVEELSPTSVSFAIVADMYWVPIAEVDAHRVRDHFTVMARVQDYTGRGKNAEQPIPTYREDAHDRPGLIGVPIAEGEHLFETDNLIEDLSQGGDFDCWTKLPDPKHIEAAPGQEEFMQLSLQAAQDNYTNLFKAETGTGKTVVALWLAATLGRSTLVRVPTVQLMHQWIEQAQDKLGLERKDIGVVQGQKCQHHKPFVVGMHKSISQRRYEPEFYKAFGTVIDDEVHNTGATMLSRNQGLFNAEYKIALTATDKRKDGAQQVYTSYFGSPAFERSMPGVRTDVYGVPYQGKRIMRTRRDQIIQALCDDHDRNRFFADLAAHWYDQGHDILMVSERVEHCYMLRRYVEALGVPEDDIGVYTNERPIDGVSGRREKTPQDYLDWCKAKPPVFIATYGMFKEGLDVPRLNRGMDCTPRSELEQLVGRIRRRDKNDPNKRAVWVSLRDRATPKLEGLHYARMRSINHIESITIRKAMMAEILEL
jgi:superfamily II DNA or RNA helicase